MNFKEQLETAATKIDSLIEQYAPPPLKGQLRLRGMGLKGERMLPVSKNGRAGRLYPKAPS
jgi:hypothetical protein